MHHVFQIYLGPLYFLTTQGELAEENSVSGVILNLLLARGRYVRREWAAQQWPDDCASPAARRTHYFLIFCIHSNAHFLLFPETALIP